MEEKKDVFISYSRKDYKDANGKIIPGNIVSKIKDMLDASNITYWFDEKGIYSGDRFAAKIAESIHDAKIFLFISTENSNRSEWTIREIATAQNFKKKIIPFRYDDSSYHYTVVLYLAALDHIDYPHDPDNAMTKLCSSIQIGLEQCRKEEEEKRKKEEAEKRKKEDEILNQRLVEQQRIEELRINIERSKSRRDAIVGGIENDMKRLKELDIELTALIKTKHMLTGNDETPEVLQQPDVAYLDSNKTATAQPVPPSDDKLGFWARFKADLATKDEATVGLMLAGLVSCFFCGIIGTIFYNEVPEEYCIFSYGALLCSSGLYYALRNRRVGIRILLLVPLFYFVVACWVDGGDWGDIIFGGNNFWGPFSLIYAVGVAFFALLLCMKKGGFSGWRTLQDGGKPWCRCRCFLLSVFIVTIGYGCLCANLNNRIERAILYDRDGHDLDWALRDKCECCPWFTDADRAQILVEMGYREKVPKEK